MRDYGRVWLLGKARSDGGFALVDVDAGPEVGVRPQVVDQRALVDERPAARVDEDGVVLHEAKLAGADHVARRGVEGNVQADHVCTAQQVVEVIGPAAGDRPLAP